MAKAMPLTTEWIRSNGGTVHSSLLLSPSRESLVSKNLPQNEFLLHILQIPSKCLSRTSYSQEKGFPPVDLRTGGKSYTFCGFVKMLELFHQQAEAAPQDDSHHDGEDNDDMEAFLNECEKDEDEVDWEAEAGDNDEQDTEQAIKAEIAALDTMADSLESAKYTFVGNDLEQALAVSDASPRHYAAILVAWELRTIYLYELAIQHVKALLTKKEEAVDVQCMVPLDPSDMERVKRNRQKNWRKHLLPFVIPS